MQCWSGGAGSINRWSKTVPEEIIQQTAIGSWDHEITGNEDLGNRWFFDNASCARIVTKLKKIIQRNITHGIKNSVNKTRSFRILLHLSISQFRLKIFLGKNFPQIFTNAKKHENWEKKLKAAKPFHAQNCEVIPRNANLLGRPTSFPRWFVT